MKLDPEQIKVIWIHDDNPIYDDNGFNWNSKNNIKNYYQTGGNLLLSRGALRYIVKDRWAISMDGRDLIINLGVKILRLLQKNLGAFNRGYLS